jgi:VIT1/CCC1 family predicted Fe2+/Mn2+ transporter
MASRSPYRPRPRPALAENFLGRLIDPIDRLSETVFSILILLTFTLAFRIIRLSEDTMQASSTENANELLIGALGAIFAWGVIDGVMYALISLFERGEKHRLLKNIQSAETEEEAVEVVADELGYILEPITAESVRTRLYQSILFHLKDSKPRPVGFTRDDFSGLLGHVIVAMIAVLPSLAPLVLLRSNFDLAIRLSNIVSVLVLFVVGFQWGKYTGASPWKTGLLLMTVAVLMVLIAIPLGG